MLCYDNVLRGADGYVSGGHYTAHSFVMKDGPLKSGYGWRFRDLLAQADGVECLYHSQQETAQYKTRGPKTRSLPRIVCDCFKLCPKKRKARKLFRKRKQYNADPRKNHANKSMTSVDAYPNSTIIINVLNGFNKILR